MQGIYHKIKLDTKILKTISPVKNILGWCNKRKMPLNLLRQSCPVEAKQAMGRRKVITLPILDSGIRMGWVISAMPQPLYLQQRDPVPLALKTGWVLGLVWMGPKNLTPTGIQTPDRPAHGKLLNKLHYPSC
jgi:hypothetical protein